VLAVATFKTRMVVHSVQPMLKVTLPPALHHATGRLGNWAEYSAKELVTILCAAHTKYANKFLNVIGFVIPNLLSIQSIEILTDY
jgi:hypothetical protein